MRAKSLTRITITIPGDLVSGADRKARELDRSRSWVVAQAVREYLGHPAPAPRVVREPDGVYEARAVAEARTRHLAHDLTLTPAERLHRSENLARLARQVRPRARRHQVIGFDTYEDYYAWKTASRAGA